MQLHQLRSFHAVVEQGSFTRAADLLGYTQQAVSQHVAAVERELGRPLLLRSWQGAVPTAEGRRVGESAQQVLLAYDALRTLPSNRPLVVGNLAPAGWPTLPRLLGEVRRLLGTDRLGLVATDPVVMWRELRSGITDVLIGYGPADGDDMVLQEVATTPRHVMHLAENGPPPGADITWLHRQRLLMPQGLSEAWWSDWSMGLGIERAGRELIDSCHGVQLAAASGLGLTVVPAGLVPEGSGHVRSSPLIGLTPARLVVARRRDDSATSAATRVAEVIAALLGSGVRATELNDR